MIVVKNQHRPLQPPNHDDSDISFLLSLEVSVQVEDSGVKGK